MHLARVWHDVWQVKRMQILCLQLSPQDDADKFRAETYSQSEIQPQQDGCDAGTQPHHLHCFRKRCVKLNKFTWSLKVSVILQLYSHSLVCPFSRGMGCL